MYRNNSYHYVSYTINVSGLLIYQTKATYELGEDGNYAEDLECGGLSEEDLAALDWLIWDEIKEYTPAQHREKWEDTCTDYSMGDLEDVVLDMVDHFMDGSGSPYSNDILTEKAFEHASTQIYLKNVKEQIGILLNTYEGNILELAYTAANRGSNPLVNALKNNKIYQPEYDDALDYLNGLAICIHSLWGNKIEVTSYNLSGNSYTYTLHYTLYDHFGIDAKDVEKFDSEEGFHSWYVLQRYDEYNSAYKPFLTLIEFDVTVSGTIS